MLLRQGVAMQDALHQSQAIEAQRLSYEEQMRQLAAAQQRVAYQQQEVLSRSVQAPPKVDDRALPCFAVPGTPAAAAAAAGPLAGVGVVGGAAPGGDPLSLVPAYNGQVPYGRTPDGRSLYKTIPGPGF